MNKITLLNQPIQQTTTFIQKNLINKSCYLHTKYLFNNIVINKTNFNQLLLDNKFYMKSKNYIILNTFLKNHLLTFDEFNITIPIRLKHIDKIKIFNKNTKTYITTTPPFKQIQNFINKQYVVYCNFFREVKYTNILQYTNLFNNQINIHQMHVEEKLYAI
ncbi:MAG: hypothetical protein AAFO15_00895 [Pseudomonadota bacterium]